MEVFSQYFSMLNRLLSLLTALMFGFYLSNTYASRAVRPWQTTKTASLGGAGIASPTMIEGLYLNPAMFSFFTNSSFYFQDTLAKLEPKSADRTDTFGNDRNPDGFTAAITDGSNHSKGGFSYTDQEESATKRKRYGFGFAGMIDGNSSVGINYSYIQQSYQEGSREIKESLHIGSIGYLNILSPQFSIGFTWNDPFWADRINSKTIFGIQYHPVESIALLLDAGQDPKRSINKTFNYSAGVEYEFYQDVFARFGVFQDKLFNLRGYGFGLGWIGARIGFEVAMKQSSRKDNFDTYLLEYEKLKETELSLLYLF